MVSPGNGPSISIPRRFASDTAGRRTVSSSEPSNPSSPAWGFSPARARRGRAMPNRGSSRAVRSTTSRSSSRVSSRGTSASGTWTVASTTFNGSDQNIIAARGAPVRCASRSVCPFHGNPAREKASLFTGAVAIAATRPSDASRTASQMNSYAARPASGDRTPASNRVPACGP